MAKRSPPPGTKRRPTAPPSLKRAVDSFLLDRDLSANTLRAYKPAYRALLAHYGARKPVAGVRPAGLRRVLREGWQNASAATWNVRAAALQSRFRYCCRQRWLRSNPADALERRRCRRDDSRAIAYDELAALWSSKAVPLRDRLLWRCLYATAARAQEVLGLNIEELDLARKRAPVAAKGGHREIIVWDAGTARLMRRYIGPRKSGPLFVTHRAPNVVPADADQAPDGRARLSYQRAWELFRKASGGRWTLHQIRHSALTHLGEHGVSAPLLMAKSRQQDLRTMARYVRPGVEAVARLTAEYDRARRRSR